MPKRLIPYLLLGVLLLAACARKAPRPPQPSTPAVAPAAAVPAPAARPTGSPRPAASPAATMLFEISVAGGPCPSGTCGSAVRLYRNQVYEFTNEAGAVSRGSVSQDRLAVITALVERTDFAAVRAVPSTRACPSPSDGQDAKVATYTFSTSHGREVISSCQSQIDFQTPLFRAVEALWQEANANR